MFGLSAILLRCWKRPAGEPADAKPLLGDDEPIHKKKKRTRGEKGKPQKAISISATEVKSVTDSDCPICFEAVGRRNQDGYLEKWIYLPCGHRFGSACLVDWLLGEDNQEHSCPTCRRNYQCRCRHLWLPQTSLRKSDRKRLAQCDPEDPVPEVCDFCDVRLRKVIPRMWDHTTMEALRRPELWAFDEGIMSIPPQAPRFPACESHHDVLWKAWYEAKLQRLKGHRRWPRDSCMHRK
ncbi:hypothetical protein SODALDRAFT_318877 [Sodiomyces alkalinus F11]|uniref:RING-type domain-containing protein n=1 Tax=Sodiomyces alkalinus (strain CBS 110278 / VKM F-3762 / F11) TaxID=1314773 RepID=A0A3N2Q5S7_SODAK|nr:hypothetical protein SODALDRAFT_318877 [Sodiomyces alkalinus F11]ROT42134.1 hypothetical protein SODALDRAFT_318877 [Sodiomyces alkalinus F11]